MTRTKKKMESLKFTLTMCMVTKIEREEVVAK